MNKISNKAKIILFSLLTIVILVVLSFIMFLLAMSLGSYDRSNWNNMLDQEKIWNSNNLEIVFSKTEYRYNGPDIYSGKIQEKDITVAFGHLQDNDKTISFYDSESKELLVKADVKKYSGKQFKIKITKDEIGLSEDEYTFTAS